MSTSHQMKTNQPKPTGLRVFLAALFGCVPAFLGGWAIAAGRIAYWTGPTERHHVVATPELSPVIYWTLVSVSCPAALALWTKSITDLIALRRGGPNAA